MSDWRNRIVSEAAEAAMAATWDHAAASGWRNRIVGEADVAPDQLQANPRNFRVHPGSQADALRGVLSQVGWVQRVIVNQRTGYVVDGHLRVIEALKAGAATVPVIYVDLDEAEEALILSTLDPLAAMAGTDAAALDALLREVSTDSPAVTAMLDALAMKVGIVEGEPIDPAELWKGMPEFEQEAADDKYKSLIVHFASRDDYEAFAQLVDQNLTDKSKFIWYPYRPTHGVAGSLKQYIVEDES